MTTLTDQEFWASAFNGPRQRSELASMPV